MDQYMLPSPFAWIDIPGKGYSISKYPITNAQFAEFVQAGGYQQRQWWTQAGWEAKEQGLTLDFSKGEAVATNTPGQRPASGTIPNGMGQNILSLGCRGMKRWPFASG
jgi:formylglycine-generating enzyme required for sulfatase activity